MQKPPPFSVIAKKIHHFVHNDAPKIMAVEAKKHAQESFENQGFTDRSLEKWKDLKPKTWKNKSNDKVLTETAHLAGSIDFNIDYNQLQVQIAAKGVEYAQVHNEGGKAGRGKGFQMPKRQFMGPSAQLNDRIRKALDEKLRKTLK